jgi:hypothetical protein
LVSLATEDKRVHAQTEAISSDCNYTQLVLADEVIASKSSLKEKINMQPVVDLPSSASKQNRAFH